MWKVEKHVESAASLYFSDGRAAHGGGGDVEAWRRCGGNVEALWPMYHENEGCHGPLTTPCIAISLVPSLRGRCLLFPSGLERKSHQSSRPFLQFIRQRVVSKGLWILITEVG